MKGAENLEMEPGRLDEENAYANVSGPDLRRMRNASTGNRRSDEENMYTDMSGPDLRRMRNASTDNMILAAKNKQHREKLILGVLLILAFITLVILTSFLFVSYKSVGEEMSQIRNDSLSSEVQSIRGAVRNLEQVQTASTYFYSDIQRIWGFLGKVAEELQKMKSSSDPLCSKGWTHYGLSCYYLSSISKSWNASKKYCEDKEAHLVVINSEGETNFLRGIANKQYLWIGLTDADGTWRWVDGTPYDVTPKFWEDNQPDDWTGHGFGGGEDCAQLKKGVKWNDLHCSEILRFVCEKKMIF